MPIGGVGRESKGRAQPAGRWRPACRVPRAARKQKPEPENETLDRHVSCRTPCNLHPLSQPAGFSPRAVFELFRHSQGVVQTPHKKSAGLSSARACSVTHGRRKRLPNREQGQGRKVKNWSSLGASVGAWTPLSRPPAENTAKKQRGRPCKAGRERQPRGTTEGSSRNSDDGRRNTAPR